MHQEKQQIHRSSLLAIIFGFLVIALICVAITLPFFRNSKSSFSPNSGIWVCKELNLSIDFDDYTATFHSEHQVEVCEVIREHNSDYIVLENSITHSILFSGECIGLSDTVLEIEESKTKSIYLFSKEEN